MFILFFILFSALIIFLYVHFCSRSTNLQIYNNDIIDDDRVDDCYDGIDEDEIGDCYDDIDEDEIGDCHDNTDGDNQSKEHVYIDYTVPHRYCFYKIKGKNPATNRRKSDYVVASTNASEDEIISRTYLLPPYEVEPYFDAPTDGQLECAKKLEICLPDQATSNDVSCLISRCHEDYGDKIVSPELIDYAANYDMLISPYCSEIRAAREVIAGLGDDDSFAFWMYVIFCVRSNIPVKNLDMLPNKDVFYGLSDNPMYDDFFIFFITDGLNIRFLFEHKRFSCSKNSGNAELLDMIFDYISKNVTF